ncbi:amidohydrolase [Anaerosinus massiliensis]|uniref:amidohydrolase n=1 Tax=Massilibacillus massiliensis TaxID=1806837 RepID=UPI000ACA924C|nr:amidohydrolase [Massilibacillus massiliensis]
MTKYLLKNATVLMENGMVQEADILIENDTIETIGSIDEKGAFDRVINCTNKLVIPGLVNTHTHAAMTLLRSYADDMQLMDWLENKIWPVEAKMKSDDIYWGSMLAIAEMIKTGTTTFADMYSEMHRVGDAVAETGIRGVLSRGMIGIAPNGQKALQENIALYNSYHNAADNRITVMFGPHAPYTCPPEFLCQVAEAAQKVGAEIHIHLSETLGEVENCVKQYKKSPIALMEDTGILDCGVLAAHCVHLSDADIALMKKYNVRVAHNPGSNMKLASGIAPVPKMLDADICVGLGTDGTSSNNNLDMFEELNLATLLHKVNTLDPLVIPALTGVKMATEYGAKAVGLGSTIGKISKGYKADIALIDMNHLQWYPRHDIISLLAYSANSSHVDTVFVNGKILLENGKLTTIDEERILYEVTTRAANLVK